ncbi:hypothetical protein [Qipengyuania qiaonensis]|uniref:Helix-turn-helix domain-containing protein n=1 Tax=Qipengyuania qiaonensis TaxID=2867240 RepID=A0ABS7J8H6_9SPHN|nr:hypothetical protein [Qipengyuania qiaonensis]MBX7483561.1 hypothetical protein [Qipengyuania qiaonensis]
MPKRPAHRVRRRPPFFHSVPLRGRCDGRSVVRQCGFLAQLYVTGSVSAAARHVGMSRATAYRLRERTDAEGFAFAWDHVLTPPGTGHVRRPKPDWRKVTVEDLIRRAEYGLVQPVVYRGRMVGIRRKPDISAALRLMRRAAVLPIYDGAGP